MAFHRETFTVSTGGRGTTDVTRRVQAAVRAAAVEEGLCTVFVHHTTASLCLCENADPDVRADLERWLARAAPDGDPAFVHVAEGPDDSPSHVRSVLTGSSLSLPVARGRADLGTWQGVYLYEHRLAGGERRISVTVLGEAGAPG